MNVKFYLLPLLNWYKIISYFRLKHIKILKEEVCFNLTFKIYALLFFRKKLNSNL